MKAPKLKPSLQQAGFYDWVQNGAGSCVLEAVAGAGKTTTLITALGLMKGSIFFGAFNKKIADEIAARAGMQLGLTVSTMHSAGFRAWKKVAKKFCKTDGFKVRDIFREAAGNINPLDLVFEGPVVHLVSLAKQAGVGIFSDAYDNTVWNELIDHFSVEVFDERAGIDNRDIIIRIARHVLGISNRLCTEIVDFDDMIYAPLLFNVAIDKYDWVLIDEAQDLNAVRRELALRMMKPMSGRLVAVGDRHQAIYGFTGADAKALDLIAEATSATLLPLTVTFRCPKKVVDFAHQWVSHIQAADTAPEGVVRDAPLEKLFEEVQVGDAILCRFNAPLVKNVYQLIKNGIPARIEGRDIAAGLKKLADRWKVKTLHDLLDKLDLYLEKQVEKFTLKENNRAIEAVTDQVACLRVIIDRVLAKGTITVPPQLAVLKEIDEIFGRDDDPRPVVLLSSIHKSKGREWKKVVWLTTGPSPFAKQPWEIEQENNLNYVAATRAMHELILIEVPKK